MVWVRTPDDALEDPRLAVVSDAAVVAYLRALGRSNRWALDGRIPRLSVPPKVVAEWLGAGLAEEGGPESVLLVWLLEYQPPAEEIKEHRRKDAERQKRNRRHRADDHSLCDPEACRVLLSRRDTARDTARDSRQTSSVSPRSSVSAPPRPDPKGSRGGESGARADEPAASSRRTGEEQRKSPLLHDGQHGRDCAVCRPLLPPDPL